MQQHLADVSSIENKVKSYILKEFLEGEEPEALTGETPLISSGILDSLATLKVVSYLEREFSIHVQAHEADVDHLNTVNAIVRLVLAKVAQ